MQITEYLNKRVFLIFLTVMLFFVSGCSKMPVGMLKQDAEQYTQEQIRLIAITEYRAAVGSNGRFQWKYL